MIFVDRGATHDLAGPDVILLSSFDRSPHPSDNMDYFIDPIERSQFDPHFNNMRVQQKSAQIGNTLLNNRQRPTTKQKQNNKCKNNSLVHHPKIQRLMILVILRIVS